jgi:hypothetical protein
MRAKKFKPIIFSIALIFLLSCYFIWKQQTVTIFRAEKQFVYDPVFEHGLNKGSQYGFTDNQYYDIAVDHMPFTEWGRIQWYLKHKQEIKDKYNIPASSSYHIAFWAASNGFIDSDKSGNGDLICFNKTVSHKDCLEKDLLLLVDYNSDEYEKFTFYGSDHYWAVGSNGRLTFY